MYISNYWVKQTLELCEWVFVDKNEQGRLAVVVYVWKRERERDVEQVNEMWVSERATDEGRKGLAHLSFPFLLFSFVSVHHLAAQFEVDKRYHQVVLENAQLHTLILTHTHTRCVHAATEHLSTNALYDKSCLAQATAKWLIPYFGMSHKTEAAEIYFWFFW